MFAYTQIVTVVFPALVLSLAIIIALVFFVRAVVNSARNQAAEVTTIGEACARASGSLYQRALDLARSDRVRVMRAQCVAAGRARADRRYAVIASLLGAAIFATRAQA
jgi:hypothetical protein